MFHYQDKLKDLDVSIDLKNDGVYIINYKDEWVFIDFEDGKPVEYNFGLGYQTSKNIKKDSHHIVVGKGNLKRDVWHISTPDGPLPTLRCGYTVHNGPNTWSSTPHPFEEEPVEGFEEVFLYLLRVDDPIWEIGRAIQVGNGMWQDGEKIEEIWRIYDRDISAIPMGYHPVVGEPGVHVSYIWAYLAKRKEWEKLP